MTQPRFLLDEHVPLRVAPELQRCGIDCITVKDAGRLGMSDEDHHTWARSAGRIIVSFDNDFLALARTGVAHAGVLRCTRHTQRIGPIVRGLVHFAATHSAEEARESRLVHLKEQVCYRHPIARIARHWTQPGGCAPNTV